MATYNKRGYKAPKEKEEKIDEAYIEDVNVDESESTTATAFNTLDSAASKTEEWVEKNQKVIFGIVLAVALVAVGYMLYNKFVADPKEAEAVDNMYTAQKNFQLAVDGTKSDSLYNLALKGSEGKQGFLAIAEDYSGTKAGNLANYYVGMSYLNTGKFDLALQYLEKFKAEDEVLGTLATGAIGDIHVEKGDLKQGLEYYKKAADANKNDFTTPRYLLKAGKTQLALGNKADALKTFTDIKDNYATSLEAQGIDALIGLAQ